MSKKKDEISEEEQKILADAILDEEKKPADEPDIEIHRRFGDYMAHIVLGKEKTFIVIDKDFDCDCYEEGKDE